MLKKKRKFVGITTLIDKDIVISGDTTYSGGIRIDGVVKGKVKVLGKEESLLVMGYGSEVRGDVEVHKAIINGTVNGNIICLDYLEGKTKIQDPEKLFLQIAKDLGHKKYNKKKEQWEISPKITIQNYIYPEYVKKIRAGKQT